MEKLNFLSSTPISIPRSGVARVAQLVLLLVAFSAFASASTLVLGSNPGFAYMGVNVGPYPGTLSGTTMTQFFCLDLDKSSIFGSTYTGTVHTPGTQAEEEAAFLASYLLTNGAPSSDPNFIAQYEGPISFAIWQIMGTLGSTAADPAAQQWITLAQNAYIGGLSSSFLNQFQIFVPDGSYGPTQSFIGYQPAVPEPSTLLMLATVLPAMLLGRRWWLRRTAQFS